jgi:putative Mn2+ efflux pump MntP
MCIPLELPTTLVIAVSLAMDAMAVAICLGLSAGQGGSGLGLKTASLFGFFQFLMPLTGWIAGSALYAIIAGFDHWLAFGILGLVGARMILGSRRESCAEVRVPTLVALLGLAIATSIDALAVGLGYGVLATPILVPAIIIGVTTFVITGAGFFSASLLGAGAGRRAELFGGIVLVAIGLRILIADLFL